LSGYALPIAAWEESRKSLRFSRGRVGRVRGGLSVMDFVKVITVQQYTRKGLKAMGPHAIELAEAEGLVGHAASVRVRMR